MKTAPSEHLWVTGAFRMAVEGERGEDDADNGAFSRSRVQHRTAVNDRALSKRERGRSRSPHREPIDLRPRPRVVRTLLETEANDPAASPCLKATDYAR